MTTLCNITRSADVLRLAVVEDIYYTTPAVLETSATPSAGDTKLDPVSGMFWHLTTSYAAYAGTDGGSTPYKFIFEDSAGKQAIAFAGAAGAGIASSTNATHSFAADLDGYTMTNDDETATFTQAGGAAVLAVTGAGTNVARPQIQKTSIANVVANTICFFELDHLVNSGTCVLAGVGIGGSGYKAVNETLTGSGTYTSPYRNVKSTNYNRTNIFFNGTNTFNVDIQEIRHKVVTEVPETGLHLFTTKNGTTRGLYSVDSGFDYGDIVSIEIYSGEETYLYEGDIKDEPTFSSELSDVFFGIEEKSDVTISLGNGDGRWDDTFDEEEIRGLEIQFFDSTDGTVIFTGEIKHYSSIGAGAEITSSEQVREFDKLIPQDLVTTDLFTDTAIDIGAAVTICFGRIVDNVPLPNIQNYKSDISTTTGTTASKLVDSTATFTDDDVGRYAYNITQGTYALITAKDSTTQLSVDTDIFDTTGDSYGIRCFDYLVNDGPITSVLEVKRDGVVVSSSEYTVDEGYVGATTDHGYSGYATIRFAKEQIGFSGEYLPITAKVQGGQRTFPTPSANDSHIIRVISLILGGSSGIGVTYNNASFVAAYSDLGTAINNNATFAMTEQRQARDYLNELLFVARSRLYQNSSGEWCIAVDKTGSSVASFGENDGYYDNCEITDCSVASTDDTIKTAYVNFDNKQISLACHTGFGTDKTFDLEFINQLETAEKLLSYVYGRSVYADKKLSLKTGTSGAGVDVGEIITVTAPDRNISAQTYRVVKKSRTGIEYNFDCELYDSRIFDDQTITDPTSQTDTSTTSGLRTITDATLVTTSYAVQEIGSIGGGTQSLDLSQYMFFTGTVDTSETTFTFDNIPDNTKPFSFWMLLTNGGSQTVNMPSGTVFPGGYLDLAVSGKDMLLCTWDPTASVWCVSIVFKNLTATPQAKFAQPTLTPLTAPGTKPATFVEYGIAGGYEFTDGTDDTVVCVFSVPDDMDRSRAPSICIGWGSPTTSADCKWQLEYLWTAAGEDMTASAQETLTAIGTSPSTAEGLTITEITGVDLPSATDTCLHCRIKRLGADAADTLGDVATAIGARLKYY